MEKHKVTCKTHDSQDRVTHVSYDGKVEPVDKVYDRIQSGKDEFYTEDQVGNKAIVKTGTSTTGRKFLTTSPDASTDNNLDELKECS